ncbi:hypothetical protein VE03_00504 [Pseudogymnoascus sp. 23342-1-I1]|nr:hypothetical protein VE03_00504 [Pseudogymnoascus sp. 23342-1-I1]
MTDDTPTPTPDRRRGSFSSTTFSAIFGPRGSTTTTTNGTGPPRQNPSPPSSTTSTTAPLPTPPSRRRMSISTLGLSGSPLSTSASASASATFFPRDRRASIASSTASSLPNSAVSESAIEDDSPDSGSVPTTPFSRHMSFGASSGLFPRGGGGVGPTSPQAKSRSPSDAGGLNWSEQFRERAASTVQRPMMGSSPPPAGGAGFGAGGFGGGGGAGPHTRARSEGGDQVLPSPARAQPQVVPQRKERRKPDEVGERMLRGEFYMD